MKSFIKEISTLDLKIKREGLPYVWYVFYLYLFIEKLYNKCKTDKSYELFFLSREGQFLKQLFDLYVDLESNHDFDTYYLYISRTASFVASLKGIDEESFDTLFLKYPNMSAEKFMINCGFISDDIEKIGNHVDFSIYETVADFANSQEFNLLKKDSLFFKCYNATREKQKANFISYLTSLKSDCLNGNINIVDVGWKGTIQDNLVRLFGNSVNVHGYYLGLNEKTKYNSFTQKEGLLFSSIDKTSRYFDVFSYDCLFLESLLFANHGSTVGYICEEGRTGPILQKNDADINSYNIIKETQNKIYSYFVDIYKIVHKHNIKDNQIEKAFSKIIFRHFVSITQEERIIKEELTKNHIDNFGIQTFDLMKVNLKLNIKLVFNRIVEFDYFNRDIVFTSILILYYYTSERYKVLSCILRSLLRIIYPFYAERVFWSGNK